MAEQAQTEMGVETLDAVADRGYYAGEEIRDCEEAGITVTLPKPMTSNSKAAGRFGKQDFRYVAAEDAWVVLPAKGLHLLHDQGQRFGLAWLPDQRLSELRYQG